MVEFSWPTAVFVAAAIVAIAWWSVQHRDDE